MRLQNGDVLLAWPLAQHVITAGWTYTSGAAHNAIDLRTQSGTSCVRPVYAAEDGTVDQAQTWDGKTCTGMQSYGNMVRLRHADYNGKKLQTRYAHALQTVQANGLTNAEAMSVYSLALALGLVGLGLYSAEYADAAHTKQNLRIGPVSAGDAKALMDKLTELGAADKAASTAA